ncbi:MAG: thermonuclease family protein [Verrucomicrobiales bacterium]
MARGKPKIALGWLIALALATFAFWLRDEPQVLKPGHTSRAPGPQWTPGQWQELTSCRLAKDRNNDGDSFRIAHAGGEHVVRLYFVDCCEKTRHHLNRARLIEQGAYFGGLDENDVIKIGRKARDEVLSLLEREPFVIFTCWESVYDSGRQYAHVMMSLPDGSRQWLCEWLVERGLARIHTKGSILPDGTPEPVFLGRLRALEKRARLARRGAWGFVSTTEDRE